MNKWTQTINYINCLPDGEIIKPKTVRHSIDSNSETITIYVNYLHKAGYLKRISRGLYQRTRLIPTNLTLSKLKDFVYPKNKSWKERKEMVIRYWKLQDLKENINNENK